MRRSGEGGHRAGSGLSAVGASLGAALVLASVVGGAAAEEMGDPERGERLFRACSNCHTVEQSGANIVGPRLYELFGRRVGSVEDYHYSEALQNLDFIWTEETVEELFALGPDVFTPGSKMPLQEMSNPRDRADLIAYLLLVTRPQQTSDDATDD